MNGAIAQRRKAVAAVCAVVVAAVAIIAWGLG